MCSLQDFVANEVQKHLSNPKKRAKEENFSVSSMNTENVSTVYTENT